MNFFHDIMPTELGACDHPASLSASRGRFDAIPSKGIFISIFSRKRPQMGLFLVDDPKAPPRLRILPFGMFYNSPKTSRLSSFTISKHGAALLFFLTTVLFLFFADVSIADGRRANDDFSTNIGREKQIVDRFWEILIKSPRRGTSFDRVYQFYIDSGHADLLIERCRQLIEERNEGPNAASAWLLFGLLLERRGEWLETEQAFEKAKKFDPQNALAPFYLAEIQIRQKQFREAIDNLEESLRRKPGRADLRPIMQTLVKIADRWGDPGKSDEVRTRLEQLFPDDWDIRQQIAETWLSDGRLEEALRQYEELARKSPKGSYEQVRYAITAADIKVRLSQENQALDDFNNLLNALAAESWPAETIRNRIEQIFEQKNDDQGLAEFYRKRIEKHPAEIESICRLVSILQRLGQRQEARQLLNEKIKRFPSSIPLRETFIALQISEEKISEALQQYADLDRIDPGNPDRIISWGRLALANPDRDEEQRKKDAVQIWSRLTDQYPNDPQAICRVADLTAQYDMPDQTERFYRRAIELKPNKIEYREYLGLFYHRRQKKEKALEMLRSIAQGPRQNVENLLYSASLLQSLGYADEAIRQFEVAADQESNNPQIRWKYAESLLLHGDGTAAFEQLIAMQNRLENDEQFAAFLNLEIRLLRNLQAGKSKPLAQLTELLEERINSLNDSVSKRQLVRLYWRLADYRFEQGKTESAIAAMEKALSGENPSPALLEAAAKLFENGGEQTKAIEIFKKLADSDGVWQIGYLKRFAVLLFETGQIDKAVETGHRLMELGSGNAANVRFFAELLLKANRREEAIVQFRQALRIEPGDIETLRLLAENLAGIGKNKEAAEIAWRLFERKETVAEKLNIVPTLVKYFQQADSFELLINRLRNGMQSGKNRRDFVLCLAAVFSTTNRLEQSRMLLENELNAINNSEANNTPILQSLVDLAEKQHDFSSAVKYQEILCRKHKSFDALDRLFILYDLNGENKKAVDLFLGGVLLKNKLPDQLDSIDRMIRREEYDAVDRVLSFLEIHDAVNWEVPYRRIALACYQRDGDVADLVEEFRNLSFSETKTERIEPTSKANIPKKSILAEWKTGPWILPGSAEQEIEISETDPLQTMLQTLFRDRLQRNEQYQALNNVPPPKPFFVPRSFRQARAFSLFWRLKEEVDQNYCEEKTADIAKEPRKRDNFDQAVQEIRTELADDPQEQERFERLLNLFIKTAETNYSSGDLEKSK